MSTVSVIVPTLDDAEHLKGLLTCLQGQDAEVVCGDGGSSDGTVELARSMGAKCCVKVGGGGIECSNLAAEQSTGDILLFMASDVRVGPNAIAQVQRRFEDLNLLGLSGYPIPYDAPLLCRLEYAGYYGLASLLDRFCFVSTGNFLAVRRSAFERLGGFRESYNNDGQFGSALKRMGKTRFDRSLSYRFFPRRYMSLGFFEFTRQRFYALENFIGRTAA